MILYHTFQNMHYLLFDVLGTDHRGGKNVRYFFVGTGNPENAWRFTWFELKTGKEYPMVFLYYALFADYWLEDEPSYMGKTETGE